MIVIFFKNLVLFSKYLISSNSSLDHRNPSKWNVVRHADRHLGTSSGHLTFLCSLENKGGQGCARTNSSRLGAPSSNPSISCLLQELTMNEVHQSQIMKLHRIIIRRREEALQDNIIITIILLLVKEKGYSNLKNRPKKKCLMFTVPVEKCGDLTLYSFLMKSHAHSP